MWYNWGVKKANKIFFLLLCLVFFGWAKSAWAADHYVREGASGANDGSDWTDAWTALPSTLTRGDTYYIADGSYGSYTFDDAESGTNVITVKKAIASDHGTESGWASAYGDGQANFTYLSFTTSYWILDGGSRNDLRNGHGFKVKQDVSGNKCIRLTGSGPLQNITLKYIEIEYLGATGNRDDGIYGTSVNNFILQYSYLHDIATNHLLVHGENNLVEHNLFARSFSTATHHSQAMQLFNSNVKNMVIRYNVFEDISGTASIAVAWGTDGLDIYGNVFKQSIGYAGDGTGTGQIVEISDPGEIGLSNAHIYNNSFVNLLQGLNSGIRIYLAASPSNYVYNNLWYNSVKASMEGITDHDYNHFYNTDIAWGTTLNGHEIGSTGDPFVDSANDDYRLKLGTLAIDAGKVLSAPFDIDFVGTVRPQGSGWDIGVYEYISGSGDTTPPAAPSGLVVN